MPAMSLTFSREDKHYGIALGLCSRPRTQSCMLEQANNDGGDYSKRFSHLEYPADLCEKVVRERL